MTTRTYQGTELELFADAARWKSYVARRLSPMIKGDVLEVGAGIGTTTRALLRPGLRSWTALEPDPVLAARAGTPPRRSGQPEVRRVLGLLDDLAVAETFDTILYVDVLEHIEDDSGTVVAAAQRLRRGGRLVVLSPAHQCLYSPFDAAVGHVRRYSRASIRSLTAPGLRLDRCEYIDSAGLLLMAANRFIFRSARPTRAQVMLWDRWLIPVSRAVDPLLGRRLGKSLIAMWTQERSEARRAVCVRPTSPTIVNGP
jgi:SAM-dependent methyltransferase